MNVYLVTHNRQSRLIIRARGDRDATNWAPVIHTIVKRVGQSGDTDPVSIELGTLADLQQRYGARFTAALAEFEPPPQ